MLPTGLALVAVSPKALKASETATMRRAYFEFADMAATAKTGYFPYTPALPLLYGLRESLAVLQEEGLENVFARHHHLEGTMRSLAARGLRRGSCHRD